ncbi:unnamed protein product [Ectocarpus sp. CCAP 1310/34]|nr:unnamed protein product [Ectocarpus sp. CCAP 1310/34]
MRQWTQGPRRAVHRALCVPKGPDLLVRRQQEDTLWGQVREDLGKGAAQATVWMVGEF